MKQLLITAAIVITQISDNTKRIIDTDTGMVCYQSVYHKTVAISCEQVYPYTQILKVEE